MERKRKKELAEKNKDRNAADKERKEKEAAEAARPSSVLFGGFRGAVVPPGGLGYLNLASPLPGSIMAPNLTFN